MRGREGDREGGREGLHRSIVYLNTACSGSGGGGEGVRLPTMRVPEAEIMPPLHWIHAVWPLRGEVEILPEHPKVGSLDLSHCHDVKVYGELALAFCRAGCRGKGMRWCRGLRDDVE